MGVVIPGESNPTVQLNAFDVGSLVSSAPPVVVLHGLLGSGSNFESWAKALAKSCEESGEPRRVMLVDLRNHGDSPHRPEMGFEDMAADVVDLLDRKGIDRAVLIGHSIGGKVAMATALLHRERVERLCVIDIAPTAYSPSEEHIESIANIIQAMRAVKLSAVSTKKDADLQLSRTVSDRGLRAFVLTNLKKTVVSDSVGEAELPLSSASFAWRVNLPAIDSSIPSLMGWDLGSRARYAGNTLFVAGGKSRFLRSSHLPEIQSSFTHFSLTTLRNASHWVHADEPDALLLIALNFLKAPSEE
jgi:pimeloyl-ACP methyl ester carboxylesterase